MELVYLWNPHFRFFKEPCFFDIYKDFFHFPNYHSILFGELYSLNRCDPSKKGKVPASRPGVSRTKYELLHLNHVLAPPQTPTHGVHWSLNDTPWYKLCISVPSVLWGCNNSTFHMVCLNTYTQTLPQRAGETQLLSWHVKRFGSISRAHIKRLRKGPGCS